MMGFSESEAAIIGEEAYFDEMRQRSQTRVCEPTFPLCVICGDQKSVTDTNGYVVCSESCYHEANTREEQK